MCIRDRVRSDCDVVISFGRVFQTRGPATENARSPTVERLTDGTIRRLVPPERNVRRPGRLATAANGPRYRGALPCNTVSIEHRLVTDRHKQTDTNAGPWLVARRRAGKKTSTGTNSSCESIKCKDVTAKSFALNSLRENS